MGTIINLKPKETLIDNFISTYKSADTIKSYTTILKEFFKVSDLNLITDYKIKNVTYQDVQNYILQLAHTKAKNTVKQRIGCLRALFNYAIEEELITINHFANIRIKGLLKKNCVNDELDAGRALSKDEIKILINTIKNFKAKTERKKIDLIRDTTLINLMLRTGLRESEVINLNWNNVKYNSIKEKWYLEITGKGNKQRPIQLTEKMYNELIEWKNLNQKDSIFGFNSTSNINKIIEKWSRLSGLGHISPHDLRRTLATNLAESGMPLEKIQQILGHESILTTQNYIKNIYRYEQNLDEYIDW